MLASISVGVAVLVPASATRLAAGRPEAERNVCARRRQCPELLLPILLQLSPCVRKPNCASPIESRLTSGHAVCFDA
jgi:hypothetical protein